MQIENLLRMLEKSANDTALEHATSLSDWVVFISERGKNSCSECLSYHGLKYKSKAPNKPELPIHPNCRCRYVPTLDKGEDVMDKGERVMRTVMKSFDRGSM